MAEGSVTATVSGSITVAAPISSSRSTTSTAAAAVPRDALILDEILRQMGVTEYNPRVVAQLLEFTHRQVLEILQDSLDYKDHAGKKELDIEDVKVTVSSRDALSIVDPPPREIMQPLARQCNSQPLPQIVERFGVRIPEERYCLTNANYRVLSQTEAQPPTPPNMSGQR